MRLTLHRKTLALREPLPMVRCENVLRRTRSLARSIRDSLGGG